MNRMIIAAPVPRLGRVAMWAAIVLAGCVPTAATAAGDADETTSFRQLQLGYVALDAGDLDGAVEHYAKARDLARGEMERFQALLGLGTAALELHRDADARAALVEAHRLRPDEAGATMLLGVACRRLGELDAAVGYLAEAAARDPELVRALVELGVAYGALERHAEQERVNRRALETDPDNPEARLGLAVALFHQESFDASVEAFRETLEVAPDNLRAHYGLGLALLYSGDRQAAIEQVVWLNERSPELAAELHGWIYEDR